MEKTEKALAAAEDRLSVLDAQLEAVYRLSRDTYASPALRKGAEKRTIALRIAFTEAKAEVSHLRLRLVAERESGN